MKQCLGNVLHANLSEEVALASLYRIHRLVQSVGNIIHRVTLGRQSQYFSLSLAQGYAFFLFPLVAQGGIFKITALTILLYDDMSRLIGCRQRYGAEGKPYSSVIRKEDRGEVMMNQSAMLAIGKVKVVRDGVVQAVAYGQFVEKVESLLVHFEQHLQVCLRHMVYIHLIASLHQLLRFQSAEISEVVRRIDEVLVEIVDDIDALVGAAGKTFCRVHQQFYLVVILLADMVHLIGVEEEIVLFVIHKAFIKRRTY